MLVKRNIYLLCVHISSFAVIDVKCFVDVLCITQLSALDLQQHVLGNDLLNGPSHELYMSNQLQD